MTNDNKEEEHHHNDDDVVDVESRLSMGITASTSASTASTAAAKREQPGDDDKNVEKAAETPVWIMGTGKSGGGGAHPRGRSLLCRSLPWIIVTILTLFLMAAVIAVVIILKRKNTNSTTTTTPTTTPTTTSAYQMDVPSSQFANPSSVTWMPLGQGVLNIEEMLQPAPTVGPADTNTVTTTNSTVLLPSRWLYATALSLSADGLRLVVASPFHYGSFTNGPDLLTQFPQDQGIVQVFHYMNDHQSWIEQARLTRPEIGAFGKSVSMASDGNRLVIGAGDQATFSEDNPLPGKVVTYNWEDNENDDNDSDDNTGGGTWQPHAQPILEDQIKDRTGTQVALNQDGTLLAVGAPYHQGKATHGGQIRLYRYQFTSTWQYVTDIRGRGFMDRVGGPSLTMSTNGATVVAANPLWGNQQGEVWTWRREEPHKNENENDEDENKSAGNHKIQPEPRFALVHELMGPDFRSAYGGNVAVSANGHVLAVKSGQQWNDPDMASVVVFAWQAQTNNDDVSIHYGWVQRGPSLPGPWIDVCLSADGNVVAVVANTTAAVFQYKQEEQQQKGVVVDNDLDGNDGKDNNDNNNKGAWVNVGLPTGAGGHQIECSADGRVFAIADTPRDGKKKVHVWKAVVPEE